ncbi:Choline/ethanolaminephosphotransferase [Seminavis robusta]|uniref:Choline/ethanolaminephosphotransferase n=1 Tax=Seminavis robusta TaxID=568900 RepID=A0A9N8DFD2_9STRA|nr:Choline/ethanolaminephosphotransferase [Seminavis robusta]|eukprot:Sro67_g037710.1 Choline/ethanolaminephosphotransferase (268) ;mRNA; r:104249-105052
MTTSYLYDYVLSPFYDWLAALIWPDWVHPNAITLIGGMFAVAASYFIQNNSGQSGWACLLFTMYHMCDNMDGKHARRTGQTSKFGGVLDHFVDGTMGNIAGFSSLALFGFGVTPDDTVFWQAIHGYYCLWLAPHVVAHFSGTLALGTKYISIDEGFITTSLVLFYAWVSEGDIVLLKGKWYAEQIALVFQVLSICYGTLLSAYHWLKPRQPTEKQQSEKNNSVWKHLSLMIFMHFWLHGILYPYSDFFHFYLTWVPVMGSVLFTARD